MQNIRYYAQGALRFDLGKQVLYTDPYKIDGEPHDADYIFISHPHFDHLSKEDILKVSNASTVIVAPKALQKEIEKCGIDRYENSVQRDILYFVLGESLQTEEFTLKFVPAYNTVKTQCHPKKNGWAGCLIEHNAMKFYYTSDTELIPEMENIQCDAIFLPMGQTYTFESVEDAAKAVLFTKAKIAVPIHYGLYEGNLKDVEEFKRILKGKVKVVVK